MKITMIRDSKTKCKIHKSRFTIIIGKLRHALERKGFKTLVVQTNSSRIDIRAYGRCFEIDPNKLGYNTRYHPDLSPRRTRTPSWDQRVKFNNIVNRVLNKLNISANVKSGDFIIRLGHVSRHEDDWHHDKPDYMRNKESLGYFIEEGFDTII